VERREWVALDAVLAEIREKIARKPDFITISGSGEPTLYSRLGELIAGIKKITDVPVAVLTNGSLLWMPEVRRDLMEADLVSPSLDAGDEQTFAEINRAHEGVTFEQMVEGLVEFREAYKGKYWLEVFLVEGVNATEAQVARMASIVSRIRPDKVQLNTVVRPPAEIFALKVAKEKMEGFASLFRPCAEIIVDYEGKGTEATFDGHAGDVLEMIRRRPCTVEDVTAGLGLHRNEVVKYIDAFVDQGKITGDVREDKVYYRAR
jgi:wyosine [tRNA(Phe)-imidazoG37] synthetase (radical SAM superfamily)